MKSMVIKVIPLVFVAAIGMTGCVRNNQTPSVDKYEHRMSSVDENLNATLTKKIEEKCNKQAQIDNRSCNEIDDPSEREACKAKAEERLAECLKKKPHLGFHQP